MRLCTPAFVYLVISIITLIANFQYSMKSAIVHLFLIGLWTYILNWVCEKGYVGISWALVLLPYVFIGFLVMLLFDVILIMKLESPYPAPYDDAPYDDAPYDDAPYTDAPYTDAPYTDAPYTDAPYTDAPYTDAPYLDSIYTSNPYTEPTSNISISDMNKENTNISISDIEI